MQDTPTAPDTTPRRRVVHFVPFGSTGRRQNILAAHYSILWEEIRTKWIPTARPLGPYLQDPVNGGMQRDHVVDVLLVLPEWDGFEVCAALANKHGWRCDADLVAIVHRWSCGILRAMRALKEQP